MPRKPFLKSLAVNPHHPAVAPEHMHGRSFAFVYQAPEGFAVDARYRRSFLDFEHQRDGSFHVSRDYRVREGLSIREIPLVTR